LGRVLAAEPGFKTKLKGEKTIIYA
jgi:hypothetical protein